MFSQIGSMLLMCCVPMLPMVPPGDEDGIAVRRGKPGQESLELRRYAITPITNPYTTPHLPIFGRIFGQRAWEKDRERESPGIWPLDRVRQGESARFLLPLPGQGEPDAPMQPEELVEFVRMTRPDDGWEREGSSIAMYMRSILQVTESKEVLDHVKAEIETLRQTLAARYEFECLIYELKPGVQDTSGGVLDAAAAAALAKRVRAGTLGRIVHTARGSGRLGDTIRFGQWRRQALQIDMDVEIAQEAVIADPVVHPLLLGHNLIVNPILAPNGRDLGLFGLFTARTQDGEIQLQDVGAPGLEMIESVAVHQVQSAFSASMPASAGLLVRPGGAGRPGLRLLLVSRRIDPWPQESGGRVLIPIGLLTAPALTCEENGLAGISCVAEQPDMIMETVRDAIGGELECQTYAEGAFLLVSGAPEKVGAARDLVRYLGSKRAASFRIDLVREARPVGVLDAPWQAFGGPVELLCLGGRLAFAQAGSERLFIGDFEVEVAQKAKISDPAVFACFEGIQAVASTELIGDQVSVRLALLDRSLLGFRTVPSSSPYVGAAKVPDLQEVVLRQDLLMKPGATVALGDGPTRIVPGRGACRTRLAIRLTRLQ